MKLRNLYLHHVVPDELISLWNNGLRRLSHIIPADQDAVAERPRVAMSMVQFVVKHLMMVDDKPTLSRFFTFRTCTDAMHTMVLIDMPTQAFRLNRVKPRKDNQKRLQLVFIFLTTRTHVSYSDG